MNVAVMGCIVNGPGESKHADIGISLPGTGEQPTAPVFVDGKKVATLRGEHIAQEFQAMVEEYVKKKYSNVIARGISDEAIQSGSLHYARDDEKEVKHVA